MPPIPFAHFPPKVAKTSFPKSCYGTQGLLSSPIKQHNLRKYTCERANAHGIAILHKFPIKVDVYLWTASVLSPSAMPEEFKISLIPKRQTRFLYYTPVKNLQFTTEETEGTDKQLELV